MADAQRQLDTEAAELAARRHVAPQTRLASGSVLEAIDQEADLIVVGARGAGFMRRLAVGTTSERLRYGSCGVCRTTSTGRVCVVEGDPSLRLVEIEQDHDCELTVLGKHGQSAVEDWLLGSVTQHVLAEAQGDVLMSARSA